jgi:alpha-tubulin suppressor-like RCC1 family protein
VPDGLDNVTAVSCGFGRVAALTASGNIVCWGGYNLSGENNVPEGLTNVTSISCGLDHTAALTADGRVVCWGRNKEGQCKVPPDLDNVVGVCFVLGWSVPLRLCGCRWPSFVLGKQ